ncbi:hypothetical protein HWN39_10760 [Lactobacillus rhamnosus]|uniref:Glycoside hydrolase family 5 domain-containing protein n=1 Tax=Lacticaseibacillus rhamnosus TaxID=47715 RepID=A0A7Y7UJB9_LACRH|nr:hypothetical protein [Lacticaseibacillus rhamnosus]NVO88959.1 hypothetical protein [Lacticaseibacillus rhamnosus]
MLDTTRHTHRRRPIVRKLGIAVWSWDEDWERQLLTAKSLGFSYIRLVLMINRSDLGKSFDNIFDRYEKVVAKAQELELDLIVSWSTDYLSKLKQPYIDYQDTRCVLSTDQLALLKSAIKSFIKAHAGQGIVYEAFNEAMGDFWSSSGTARTNPNDVHSWVSFDRWLGAEVKKLDSTSTYATLCGTGCPGDYLQPTYSGIAEQQGLFDNNADLVSWHPYVEAEYDDGRPEHLLTSGQMRNVSVETADLPMISTEFGYSRFRDNENYTWQGLWNIDDAANYTVRQALLLDMLGWPIIGVFDMGYDNYGLLDWPAEVNKVGMALKELSKNLAGFSFEQRVDCQNPNLFCLKYVSFSGDVVFVYWAAKYQGEASISIDGRQVSLLFTESPQYLRQQAQD